jgi:hypothetical protein
MRNEHGSCPSQVCDGCPVWIFLRHVDFYAFAFVSCHLAEPCFASLYRPDRLVVCISTGSTQSIGPTTARRDTPSIHIVCIAENFQHTAPHRRFPKSTTMSRTSLDQARWEASQVVLLDIGECQSPGPASGISSWRRSPSNRQQASLAWPSQRPSRCTTDMLRTRAFYRVHARLCLGGCTPISRHHAQRILASRTATVTQDNTDAAV